MLFSLGGHLTLIEHIFVIPPGYRYLRSIMLMVQKSGEPVDMENHQFLLEFHISQVVVWDFFHQQYLEQLQAE